MPRTLVGSTNVGLYSKYSNFYNAPTTNISLKTMLDTRTYPLDTTAPYSQGYFAAPTEYFFYLRATTTNTTKGNVGISYPWEEYGEVVGNLRQTFTFAYSYITIYVNVNYGYSFKGWYTAYSGGTQITTSTTVNVSHTDTYANGEYYAQFN